MFKAYSTWLRSSLDLWTLAADASAVVAQRTAKLALGQDYGGREARLMVAEKVRAAVELQTQLMTGALGSSPPVIAAAAVRQVGRKVAANRRRLGR